MLHANYCVCFSFPISNEQLLVDKFGTCGCQVLERKDEGGENMSVDHLSTVLSIFSI